MRHAVSILLALLAAAGVWVLLSDGDTRDPERDADLESVSDPARGDAGDGGERTPMTVEPRRGRVEVVPAGSWDPPLDEEERAPLPPAVTDHELRSPDGQDWHPTGAQILEILGRELPDLTVRFEDEKTLADFRGRTWPHLVPRVTHLGMVLQMMEELGYRAVAHRRALYMVRVPER